MSCLLRDWSSSWIIIRRSFKRPRTCRRQWRNNWSAVLKSLEMDSFAPLPTYPYCKQISAQEFDEQKVSTSPATIAELLEDIIKNKGLPLKEKKKKAKAVSEGTSLDISEEIPSHRE
ncbi:DEP domain-containing protein 1A [Fukomys damarensis]|uniref:DEP domain-containing protein 1A n=1 Tax=Fukomys damarensis TaxID=885580 RepID=A0A091CN65_FUKDA|nr:DEP domain-containing protein 1A [Fukomys damarensis]